MVNSKHKTLKSSYSKQNIKNIFSLLLPLIFSLGLGLRGINVGEPHVDVYQILGVFEPSWSDLIRDFFSPEGLYGGFQAPIYFLIGKAFGTLFGTELFQLRLLSLLGLSGLWTWA